MDVPSLSNLLFCSVFFLGFLENSCVGQKLEISAFEYNRKFGSALDIGQCSLKIEEISTGVPVTRSCNLPNKQGPIRSVSKVLNDTRNFEVRRYNDIFVFMGLCDAKTVSSLGLLHKGDCFAVEIASNLTFNRKTYIRAYVEYYRRSVDIQEDGIAVNPAMAQHYNGAYYLRDRSYGILEIIVVEMKFRHARAVKLLTKANYQSQSMHDHMIFADNEAGEPYNTKIIRISTAENKVEMTQFRRKQFLNACRHVKRYEQDLYRLREEMYSRKPHLNYGMLPFLPKPRALGLSSGGDMLTWETATAIEITINRGITIYKTLKRTCNRAKIPRCSLLKYVKRELRSIKTIIHNKRSKWSYLPAEEQVTTNKLYSGRVRRIQKEIASIRKSLKQWRIQQRKTKTAIKLAKRRKAKSKSQKYPSLWTRDKTKDNRVHIS
ncbi:uncharacterized protein LOC110447894 [Mizuhopecten yessoensis]|uniref:Uncharacterized protein n=1 Tax=Mizuhopecten yessoensis TaxID=6573 RepID=A0A210QUC9_MIZYE|nr:uncharacterized protein LOC110447894 [Mizuhopecten yessoensis]OWF52344.1 hypothetical protein KP79_PYT20190 [Mizuhopecten yessoensis]